MLRLFVAVPGAMDATTSETETSLGAPFSSGIGSLSTQNDQFPSQNAPSSSGNSSFGNSHFPSQNDPFS